MKKQGKTTAGHGLEPGGQEPSTVESMMGVFFNMVPDLFCVATSDGYFKRLNPAWEKLMGYTSEELCSRPFVEFVHPDDVEKTLKEVELQLSGEETIEFVNRYLTKSGVWKWLEWRARANSNRTELYAVARDVTDRVIAQKSLQESEEKYEIAFRTSPDAININKMDGTYVDINEGFTNLTGFTRDDVIGRPSLELGIWTNPEDRIKLVEGLEKNGRVKNLEAVFRCKNGSLLTGLMSAALVNFNNEPHILSITRDITNRKRTEEEIRESEIRFRQIAENSSDFIWEVDKDGVYTYCSSIVSTILGYSVEEVVGHKHFYDFFEPSIREELKTGAFQAFGRKESFRNFINNNIHKDGHLVIIETNGSPLLDKNGDLVGYRGTDTDITQRVLFETALRESEQKYRLLAINSKDVIWRMNLSGEFTFVSPSVERFQGFTPEECLAHGIEGSLTPASADLARKTLAESVKEILSGSSLSDITLTLEHRHKNGSTLWAEVTVSKLVNDEHELLGFVGITRDITERRKVEQRLIQTMAAVDSASDAIGISDQNNNTIYRNKAMVDLFGFESAEELENIGGWQTLLKDKKNGKALYERIISGKSFSGEIEMVTRNNRVFPAFVRANPIHDNSGTLIGLLGIITDITARVRAEENLKNSEEIFRSLAEYSPNMIVIILKNRIHYVNQLCVRKLGYSKEELYAEDFEFDALASPEHRKLLSEKLTQNAHGKEIEPYEFLMTAKDGRQLYTMVTSKIIQMGNENAILGVIMDISEQRWAEEILKRKANQFEHFSSLMAERELKMVELKREVNELLDKLGEEPRYKVYSDQPTL